MFSKITNYELRNVEKPARYVGGEYNSIKKDKNKLRWALCFPDLYDIGMSNLGLRILYNILNNREDTWCERVYAPFKDYEKLLREKNIKLYGLESKDSLDKFDIVGFTLQYEMSYTNILNMLDLSGIPLYSEQRMDKNFPLIVAGGPCACNPYPLSPFFDLFMLGEGEEIINVLTDKYIEWKNNGKLTKLEFLESLKDIDGLYIPIVHKDSNVRKVIINDFDKAKYPTSPVVTSTEIVQDKISLEVLRGCTRGCRFCQAGYIYRPVREKSSNTLFELAKCNLKSTGINEISLASLSTSDHSEFNTIVDKLLTYGEKEKVTISLPSLRIDSLDIDSFKRIHEGRNSNSLTFAIESGSQRLRDVINKNITEEEIFKCVRFAFFNGYNKLKLYFMLGLPTETMEDVESIVTLTNKIIDIYYNEIPKEKRKGKLSLSVSTATFVPKAHTPFEFFAQDKIEGIYEKQNYLKANLNRKIIKYSYTNPYVSKMEALIARGDEKISDVIYNAWKLGAKFDSYDEHFNKDVWEEAIKLSNINVDEYIYTNFDTNHKFCFDNIFHGVTKEFLIREYNKAIKATTTPKCSLKCSNCGVRKIAKCKFVDKE